MQSEYVGKLFTTVLAKFQQELSARDQLPVMLWLRYLLKEQWTAILKQNKNADLVKLLQIQAFIAKKTSTLQKCISLKGKLEMARRTIELKSSAQSKGISDPLVYKDAADSDDEMQSVDSDEADGEDGESEDEEIIEIPLDKRRIVDESDEGYGDQIDDSVSSSGESDSMAMGDAEEEGEVGDYGSEDGADVRNIASSGESMASGDEDMDSEDLIR